MDSWVLLAVAGLFEISWAVGLKYTEGFSRLLPSVLTILGSVASFVFLSLALKRLPLSIAYAVWTGMGIAGTSVLGVFLFREAFSLGKLFFIGLIVAGIVGLRLNS